MPLRLFTSFFSSPPKAGQACKEEAAMIVRLERNFSIRFVKSRPSTRRPKGPRAPCACLVFGFGFAFAFGLASGPPARSCAVANQRL